jgi:hypothetical protein
VRSGNLACDGLVLVQHITILNALLQIRLYHHQVSHKSEMQYSFPPRNNVLKVQLGFPELTGMPFGQTHIVWPTQS